MKIFIKKNTDYYNPILYVFKIIEKNRNLVFEYVEKSSDADIIFDYGKKYSEKFSLKFYKKIRNPSSALVHKNIFPQTLMIYDEKGDTFKDLLLALSFARNRLF